MKRAMAALLAALMTISTAFAVTGCGSEPKTIETYVTESPTVQQEIEESLKGLENSDMDVRVTYDQNRIIITCDMKSTYKKNVLKTIKKTYRKYMKKNLTEPMENAVGSIEQETGITGVSIQVIVNNGDGSEIWSQIYPIEEETETTEAESESTAAE